MTEFSDEILSSQSSILWCSFSEHLKLFDDLRRIRYRISLDASPESATAHDGRRRESLVEWCRRFTNFICLTAHGWISSWELANNVQIVAASVCSRNTAIRRTAIEPIQNVTSQWRTGSSGIFLWKCVEWMSCIFAFQLDVPRYLQRLMNSELTISSSYSQYCQVLLRTFRMSRQ
jgi:hypothetical protein